MNRTEAQSPNLTQVKRSSTPDISPVANDKRYAFADRLEKLEQRVSEKKTVTNKAAPILVIPEPDQPPKAAPNSANIKGNFALEDRSRKPLAALDEDINSTQQSSAPFAAANLRSGPIQVQSIATQIEVPPAHLERMASAIQELHSKDTNAQYQLHLPLGPTYVESAIMGQDAQGRISIQLLTPAILPPQLMASLSNLLTLRLRQKDLRVGEVKFTSEKVREKPRK